MDFDVDPIWGVWKAALLTAMWVLNVPPLELVLVIWECSEVEDFHSEFVVALTIMVKILGVAEMCFFARCRQSDLSIYLPSP